MHQHCKGHTVNGGEAHSRHIADGWSLSLHMATVIMSNKSHSLAETSVLLPSSRVMLA